VLSLLVLVVIKESVHQTQMSSLVTARVKEE